ncbi:uncharacterized protein HD556DRAFT_1530680 [Suillus plorans]|uniref:DUF6533 domain-containing protein n=1 Tax=Suillus plorans TaxID=116603 RepID=A0A9P7DBX6_9AGAM|nr:uncharacterized protein HD556DRAFT_1530680 [Suillus plorans]KAG1787098.1 hypothetical protein HD556DRAFT_1530680 [Suillus plorans]
MWHKHPSHDTSTLKFAPRRLRSQAHPKFSNSMSLVSSDPSWWPFIDSSRISSCVIVASSAGVIYDWALTFGQEIELVWRQRFSLMTVLYLSVRYVGILYAVVQIPVNVQTISHIYIVSQTISAAMIWMTFVANVMLGVIMITRLHAMYQRSRKVLIILIAIFLAICIAVGVLIAITGMHISEEDFILSGTYQCIFHPIDGQFLSTGTWIILGTTAWEIVALCFVVRIAVKHFRELRRYSTGGIVGDYFTVLVKSHIVYFASFLVASCFELGYLFPEVVADLYTLRYQLYYGVSSLSTVLRLFVLGPRLILDVREHHAKLVADSDAENSMTSIAFQERVHVSTSSSV